MELGPVLKTSSWNIEGTLGPPLGLGISDLLRNWQAGNGYATLFKEILRIFGQHSTRFLIKRHGYELGRKEARQMLARQAGLEGESLAQAFISHLRTHLPRSFLVCEQLAGQSQTLAVLEWHCPLGKTTSINHENRINQENAFVWLLKGYATSFLGMMFERSYQVTYTRIEDDAGVTFRFFARPSQNLSDFDQDLLLPDIHSNAELPPTTILANQPTQYHKSRVLNGESELASILRQVAVTNASVLLQGESGVGKSLIARELHSMSLRSNQPWVEINCAAMPEQLLESELFGVERGAFSGANLSRKGKFEYAHGGTVFLDEVALLSPGAQSKLLRVLQSGEFERLGSNLTIRCDVRVIAATNEPLLKLVRDGRFREDLYYRLNVFPVTIPSLRERKNEIPDFASSIIRHLSEKYGKKILRCSPQAREFLLAYDWPGNIREMENVLERAVILCPDATEIQPAHFGDVYLQAQSNYHEEHTQARPTTQSYASPVIPIPVNLETWAEKLIESQAGSLNAIKDALLRSALRLSNGNLNMAAASLGMTKAQLTYQLKKINETAAGTS